MEWTTEKSIFTSNIIPELSTLKILLGKKKRQTDGHTDLRNHVVVQWHILLKSMSGKKSLRVPSKILETFFGNILFQQIFEWEVWYIYVSNGR